MLLKLDTREAERKEEEGGQVVARPGYTEFVSHTVWAHQMDFEEWKRRYRFSARGYGSGRTPLVVFLLVGVLVVSCKESRRT